MKLGSTVKERLALPGTWKVLVESRPYICLPYNKHVPEWMYINLIWEIVVSKQLIAFFTFIKC